MAFVLPAGSIRDRVLIEDRNGLWPLSVTRDPEVTSKADHLRRSAVEMQIVTLAPGRAGANHAPWPWIKTPGMSADSSVWCARWILGLRTVTYDHSNAARSSDVSLGRRRRGVGEHGDVLCD